MTDDRDRIRAGGALAALCAALAVLGRGCARLGDDVLRVTLGAGDDALRVGASVADDALRSTDDAIRVLASGADDLDAADRLVVELATRAAIADLNGDGGDE